MNRPQTSIDTETCSSGARSVPPAAATTTSRRRVLALAARAGGVGAASLLLVNRCSGVGESPEVLDQSLIDAHAGRTLRLPARVHIVDRLFLPDGITLEGAGPRTVLRLMSQTIDEFHFGGVLNTHGVADVTIRDLTVDGNRTAMTLVGDALPHNIEGVDCDGSSRIRIERVGVTGAVGDGIDIDASDGVRVSDSHMWSCGGYGVHLSHGSSRCRIESCVAEDCGFANDRGGMDTHFGASDNTYFNCLTRSCRRGFHLKGPRTRLLGCRDEGSELNNLRVELLAQYSTIREFTGRASGAEGITVDTSNVSVAGCRIERAAGSGLRLLPTAAGLELLSSEFSENEGWGIHLQGSASTVTGCVMSGNAVGAALDEGAGNSWSTNET